MVETRAERERNTDARSDRSRQNESGDSLLREVIDFQANHSGSNRAALEQGRRQNTGEAHLPNLEFFDSSTPERSYLALSMLNLQSSDLVARPIVERSGGTINKFTDINGNQYRLQGDRYINPSNPAQTEGVYLSLLPDGSVRMRDRETRIVRTTSPDGLETTEYGPRGGRVMRRIDGNVETMNFEDRGGRQRSLVLERNVNGAMVRSYTDGSGVTYTFNGQRRDGNAPLYSAVDRDGRELGRNFTVNADRSGNVIVNNYDQPNSPTFARRELNNGVTVTSGRSGESRTITDAFGSRLDPSSESTQAALRTRMISEVPRNLDLADHERQAQLYMRETHMSPELGTLRVATSFRTLFDGGEWDPKSAGAGNNVSNMEYEAFGNWQYGYLGRMSGFSEDFLRTQAGRFQYSPRPEWGQQADWLGRGHTGNRGDDPEDTRFIDRGFSSFNSWEQSNREQVAALRQPAIPLI